MSDYFKIVNEAIELVVETDDETGISYLIPQYKELLFEQGIVLDKDKDPREQDELYEIVKLEVEKRNALNNYVPYVARMMYELFDQKINPTVTDEENEMIANMLEYMKEKNALQEREKDIENRERAMSLKNRLKGNGLNFAKKKEK